MRNSSNSSGKRGDQPDMSMGLSHARHGEREPEKRELDLGLFRRMFAYTRPYKSQRGLLFMLVLLRGAQIPTIGWAISAVINGPVAKGNWHGTIVGCVFSPN